jgi:uncharacterized protein
MAHTTSTINPEITAKVAEFGRVLERDGIPVEKLLIFGSYAKQRNRKDSDIDVAVVSAVFGKDDIDEMQMLFKKRQHVDTRIEPYPLSSEDFAHGDSPIVEEIRAHGVEV